MCFFPIVERPVALQECKLRHIHEVNDAAGNPASAVVIGEVVMVHVHEVRSALMPSHVWFLVSSLGNVPAPLLGAVSLTGTAGACLCSTTCDPGYHSPARSTGVSQTTITTPHPYSAVSNPSQMQAVTSTTPSGNIIVDPVKRASVRQQTIRLLFTAYIFDTSLIAGGHYHHAQRQRHRRPHQATAHEQAGWRVIRAHHRANRHAAARRQRQLPAPQRMMLLGSARPAFCIA